MIGLHLLAVILGAYLGIKCNFWFEDWQRDRRYKRAEKEGTLLTYEEINKNFDKIFEAMGIRGNNELRT